MKKSVFYFAAALSIALGSTSCGKKCNYNSVEVPCDLMGVYDLVRKEKAKVDEFTGSKEEKAKLINAFISLYESKKDSLGKFTEATKKPSQINWDETIAKYKEEMSAKDFSKLICKKWNIDEAKMSVSLENSPNPALAMQSIEGMTMDIKSDGTYERLTETNKQQGTWKLSEDGKTLTLAYMANGKEYSYDYIVSELSENALVYNDAEGQSLYAFN